MTRGHTDSCETCWNEAATRLDYAGHGTDALYREALRKHHGFGDPDAICGGISVNGATPRCCEVHLLPWGHKRRHQYVPDAARVLT